MRWVNQLREVWQQRQRQKRLALEGTWRKRTSYLPKIVWDVEKEDYVEIPPNTEFWENYSVGHYGYEGGWTAYLHRYRETK